jgi:hypothetical protein
MKRIITLLQAVMLLLTANAQSVSFETSKHDAIKATSSTATSELEVVTQENSTWFDLSYTGVEVQQYRVEIINNATVVHESYADAGPRIPALEVVHKYEVNTLEVDNGLAIGWLRALRLLPCIEGEYNSDGSWYIEFDCYEGREATTSGGGDAVPVEVDGVQTEGTAVRITPITDEELNLKNISLTKF